MVNIETLYLRIGRLIEAMPDLQNIDLNAETHKWLADAYALVNASGDLMAPLELKLSIDKLCLYAGYQGEDNARIRKKYSREIQVILYRALSVAELKTPAASQGSFIPAGNAFDAMVGITKVFDKAKKDIFIVDPYLDEKVLTEFGTVIQEKINIRLLTAKTLHKSSLKPATQKWVGQYGVKRQSHL